ncbi:thioredoxin [Halorhodospira abdelmalekii]|uniref:thioredoxin n=1 Tax=Halorhodospira abdelmalekii TaxID=421629 RepID=UPI001902CD5C|nr:thioredoxin [Halorhodospira abdelmalekii]MBK1735270.1 thioredoxin [Halorhodospira abdelmalekii]
MSTSPHVIEITAENFKEQALDASLQQPVLIYFWAQWCEPCKTLSPLLERLADEYRGGFRLAKVDCDQQQQLAMQVGIQSLPTALLIKEGQPVDQFVGAVPEGELRKWLGQHVEAPPADPLTEGKALLLEGRAAEAVPYLRTAQRQRGDTESTLELARALLQSGESDEACALVEALPSDERNDPRAQAILSRKELAEQVKDLPDRASLEQQLAATPEDDGVRMHLALQLIVAGDELSALEHLLHLIRHDRERRDEAHQLALKTLGILGPEHPEARRYRQKLFQLLH